MACVRPEPVVFAMSARLRSSSPVLQRDPPKSNHMAKYKIGPLCFKARVFTDDEDVYFEGFGQSPEIAKDVEEACRVKLANGTVKRCSDSQLSIVPRGKEGCDKSIVFVVKRKRFLII